jgi:hypothetical protein
MAGKKKENINTKKKDVKKKAKQEKSITRSREVRTPVEQSAAMQGEKVVCIFCETVFGR